MLPTPSRPCRRLPRVALAAAALAATALAPAARALDLELSTPHVRAGTVWVDVRLYDLFVPRVEATLARGMPARLQIHAELWRKRSGWFDRLSGSFDAPAKIRYDVWSKAYRLERPGASPFSASTLDSIRLVLSQPVALPLAPVRDLLPDARYYVVLSVTLKPLSVEDVEEGEGWLSGEVARRGRSGVGVITAIPRSLFDAVRNFAGLGDQRARSVSDEFELEGAGADR